jgi:hypothetical protein
VTAPAPRHHLVAGILAILHGDALTGYEVWFIRPQAMRRHLFTEAIRHLEDCRAARVLGPVTASWFADAPGLHAILTCPHSEALRAYIRTATPPPAAAMEIAALGAGWDTLVATMEAVDA